MEYTITVDGDMLQGRWSYREDNGEIEIKVIYIIITPTKNLSHHQRMETGIAMGMAIGVKSLSYHNYGELHRITLQLGYIYYF